jgi:hypothetical protein
MLLKTIFLFGSVNSFLSIPVAAPSQMCIWHHSLAGIAGSNRAVVIIICLFYTVRCQVEFSAMGQSLVQRNPAECGVLECDLETSTMRMGCRVIKNSNLRFVLCIPSGFSACIYCNYLQNICHCLSTRTATYVFRRLYCRLPQCKFLQHIHK